MVGRLLAKCLPHRRLLLFVPEPRLLVKLDLSDSPLAGRRRPSDMAPQFLHRLLLPLSRLPLHLLLGKRLVLPFAQRLRPQ